MSNWDISDWQFVHYEDRGDAITIHDTKTIHVDCTDIPMLLHELAHAISGQGHTGYFADIFTELVGLNMTYHIPTVRKMVGVQHNDPR